MNALKSFMITIIALLRLRIYMCFQQKSQLHRREKMKLLFILDNQMKDFWFYF